MDFPEPRHFNLWVIKVILGRAFSDYGNVRWIFFIFFRHFRVTVKQKHNWTDLVSPCSVYSGHQSILIPPSELEVNPALWLSAVSQYKVRDTFCSYSVMELCTKGLGLQTDSLKVRRALAGEKFIIYALHFISLTNKKSSEGQKHVF